MSHFETVTVGELKARLNDFHDDAPVVAVCNFGDRGRTMQAIAIGEPLSGYCLKESGYSYSGYKVSEDGDGLDVIVLNPELLD